MPTTASTPRPSSRPRAPRSPGRRVPVAVAGAVVAVLAVGAPAAYATLDSEQRSAAQTPRGASYIETRLFFGTERPDGGADVTDRQFMAFIDRHVTPEFPSGLTIQEGRGQWRDSKGVIERERSYELILLYPASEATSRDARIDRIRQAYQRAHAQDSVARLDERTFADF
ncbi:DUF3574 domain-containing protein [Streptomyces sp. IB2014 016-6]|uniref:DUF3574 domain-containing protein n=1 Tax=Streptomyces sp. IB2014 016-6 TaxID=2517818 RepID=UPI0011C8629B|nr:DUF3574 domain-containing protein [Streptomyces sp. IB2014 016-6]TXL93051.1 DUF3574 domain-containing protein [Streptomyces sp. IB2014 016-6]